MSDVEALAVGQELLDLAGEDEVGEEPRCAGMGREAHDGRGRKDQRDAVTRVRGRERGARPAALGVEQAVIGAVDAGRALSREHGASGIVNGLHEHDTVLRELSPEVPAVELLERDDLGHDGAGITRMRHHETVLPFGFEQVFPGVRHVGAGDVPGVVGHDDRKRPPAPRVAVGIAKAVGKAFGAGRRVAREQVLAPEQDVVAGVRGVDDVGVLDSGGQLLHHPLQDPLGPRAMNLDLDPVGLLEPRGQPLGRVERQRRVPDHLAFAPRLGHPRVLRRCPAGRQHQGEQDERCDALTRRRTRRSAS